MSTNLQTTFQDIHAKHATYDSIIEARGAGGRAEKADRDHELRRRPRTPPREVFIMCVCVLVHLCCTYV